MIRDRGVSVAGVKGGEGMRKYCMTRHGKGEDIEKGSSARSKLAVTGCLWALLSRHRGRDQPDAFRPPDELGRRFAGAGDRLLSNIEWPTQD